jgi:uncharacterized membrane protein YvbJ
VARCEVCGSERPAGDAYCGVCGHRLGAAAAERTPHEPVVVDVQVRPARKSWLDGCVSCVSWVALVFVVLMLVGWALSC